MGQTNARPTDSEDRRPAAVAPGGAQQQAEDIPAGRGGDGSGGSSAGTPKSLGASLTEGIRIPRSKNGRQNEGQAGSLLSGMSPLSSSLTQRVALADAMLEPTDLLFEADGMSQTADDKLEVGTPPGEYGQEIPKFESAKAPPSLPPHLLQPGLNSEDHNRDPTHLPLPNHVMLNHLYALAVKDNVIVLGATHRYRQKYVTTVLYKPLDVE
eukprot:m.108167 g.108167  ORF g.108167 m.108167 type:complete len:211 (+) comp14271_c0_seq2:81-713(+)